jgi:hypothetical protein
MRANCEHQWEETDRLGSKVCRLCRRRLHYTFTVVKELSKLPEPDRLEMISLIRNKYKRFKMMYGEKENN